MTRYFLFTILIFSLSAGIFYETIINIDPLGEQRYIAFLAFFLSAFFGSASFFTFFFFFGSEVIEGKILWQRHYLRAMRRGALIAVFIVSILLFQLYRILGPLEAVLLATFLALVEYMSCSPKGGVSKKVC